MLTDVARLAITMDAKNLKTSELLGKMKSRVVYLTFDMDKFIAMDKYGATSDLVLSVDAKHFVDHVEKLLIQAKEFHSRVDPDLKLFKSATSLHDSPGTGLQFMAEGQELEHSEELVAGKQ